MPPATFIGMVTKVGAMQKTATVTVSRTVVHKKTGKELLRTKKFLTHDEHSALRLQDTVVIRNCRPLSARKRFTLERIVKSPDTERDEMHRQQAEAQAQAMVAESRSLEAESRSVEAESRSVEVA